MHAKHHDFLLRIIKTLDDGINEARSACFCGELLNCVVYEVESGNSQGDAVVNLVLEGT